MGIIQMQEDPRQQRQHVWEDRCEMGKQPVGNCNKRINPFGVQKKREERI